MLLMLRGILYKVLVKVLVLQLVQHLVQLVDQLPQDALFTVMGVGTDELPATTQSILLGGHVRVGFEDNVYYRKGELAESNAQLVARAARIGRELGCEIASPVEAREILGIPQLGQ